MKALIQIKTTYRPCSREVIGFRLRAAVPNLAARRMFGREDGSMVITKQQVPSFSGRHLIAESMDYGDKAEITDAELDRFKLRLKWEGFDEYEVLTKDEKPSKLSDEDKAKIDRALGLV